MTFIGFVLSLVVTLFAHLAQGKNVESPPYRYRILLEGKSSEYDLRYATRTSPLGLRVPEPSVLTYKNKKWIKTKLVEWERIKAMIIARASAKIKVSDDVDDRALDNAKAFLGKDGVSVQMSETGQFALINLQFRSVYFLALSPYAGSQCPRFQNWFGFWDLEKNKLIKEWTSTDLDGEGQREPQPEDYPEDILWSSGVSQ